MAKSIRKAVGSEVRTYLREQGVEVGSRGLFSAAQIKAFNDAHKGTARYEKGNVATVDLKVKVRSASGKVRTETRAFPLADVRAASGTEGKRGRLSAKSLETAAKNLSAE